MVAEKIIFLQMHNTILQSNSTKLSSVAGHTRHQLDNTSTCPHVCFDTEHSHHQLQDALDIGC